MVTHNPVKLVMKQTLILKNSAAIKIYLCTAVGQTDLIPPGETKRTVQCLPVSELTMCVSDSLNTSGHGTWIPKQIL